jgi:DNA-binding MarR family transcriptional regulator
VGEPPEIDDMSHPTTGLDETVHQRVRLGILAVLAEADKVDFTYLRDRLDVTDGNLNRHLQVLNGAGFVQIEKRSHGRRKTWVLATRRGREAFTAHLARLQRIIDASKETP